MRGDGRVYKRGETWWLQYSVGGKVIRESSKTSDVEKAKKRLALRIKASASPDFVEPKARRLKVSEMIKAFLDYQENRQAEGKARSLRTMKIHLKPIESYFGSHRAASVGANELETFRRERRAQGRAPATVDRELELLRSAYRYAVKKWKRLPATAVPEFEFYKPDNTRQGFLTLADLSALQEHIPDAGMRDFLSWAFVTGMRRNEASSLTCRTCSTAAASLGS